MATTPIHPPTAQHAQQDDPAATAPATTPTRTPRAEASPSLVPSPGVRPAGDSTGRQPIAALVRGASVQAHAADHWQPVTADRLVPQGRSPHGWAGWIAYEIGHLLEPTSTATGPGQPPGPPRLDPDWGLGGWVALGRPIDARAEGLALDGDAGQPPGERAVQGRDAGGVDRVQAWPAGPMRSLWGQGGYARAVARTIGLIHAGDAYQVNLAHALEGSFAGCPRRLFAALASRARPALGCYLELPPLADGRRRAILSLSPELLVRYDAATRTLTTEPMKGTRPATPQGRGELSRSPKDRAELAMIVDLMRNDLGRVCEVGSVQVRRARMIRRHGPPGQGVWQASARVSGRLRSGLALHDALAALLPAGSITGAPKIRAMQIINQLEPTPRGPYCGAIGRIDPQGNAELAVGIRTAVLVGDRLRYAVGAGIVADSDPLAEWAETLAKAGPLRAAGLAIEDDHAGRRMVAGTIDPGGPIGTAGP
ncbi:MAG: hypothetical protein KatS3mg103_1002 [Phycisphaerales bacterium]|nr:MAG: hypothetical protein KatS3mg103_1002 [Phycisphaerales bacterium]